MSKYQFSDISHHEGFVDMQTIANKGHRIVIIKASDSYHMPDINGKYDFSADRHHDAHFVMNFVNARETGLLAAAYHFVRFDRPLPLSDRDTIIKKNLEYFKKAIAMLPEEYQDQKTVVVDMEQSGSQLIKAGLTKAIVSDMAMQIIDLFCEAYENVIFYSGSWWTDEWLTKEASAYIATKTSCWEPEYVTIVDNDMPVNPEYKPSVPYGFSNEYATKADDIIGKLFAWQYTDDGLLPPMIANFDLNLTEMPKEELYILLNQDGAVDPPNPDNGDYDDEFEYLFEQIDYIQNVVEEIQETVERIELDVQDLKDGTDNNDDDGGDNDDTTPPDDNNEVTYRQCRYIQAGKDRLIVYNQNYDGDPPDGNGKTKLSKAPTDQHITQPQIWKFVAVPEKKLITLNEKEINAWVFEPDGDEVNKRIIMASNLEEDVEHQYLALIRHPVSNKLVFISLPPVADGSIKDINTKEYWFGLDTWQAD